MQLLYSSYTVMPILICDVSLGHIQMFLAGTLDVVSVNICVCSHFINFLLLLAFHCKYVLTFYSFLIVKHRDSPALCSGWFEEKLKPKRQLAFHKNIPNMVASVTLWLLLCFPLLLFISIYPGGDTLERLAWVI